MPTWRLVVQKEFQQAIRHPHTILNSLRSLFSVENAKARKSLSVRHVPQPAADRPAFAHFSDMATLAESFLADLEDLSDDEEPQQQQEGEAEGEDQDVSLEHILGHDKTEERPLLPLPLPPPPLPPDAFPDAKHSVACGFIYITAFLPIFTSIAATALLARRPARAHVPGTRPRALLGAGTPAALFCLAAALGSSDSCLSFMPGNAPPAGSLCEHLEHAAAPPPLRPPLCR